MGSTSSPREAGGWTPGPTGSPREGTLESAQTNAPRPPTQTHTHVLPQPLHSSSSFLSKQTLGGGDGGGRAQRRGNPGNKPQTHASGPARPSRRLGSPPPARLGVAGERLSLPGEMVRSRSQSGRWRGPSEMLHRGPAAATLRPPGPEPRRGCSRALLPRGTAVRSQTRGLGGARRMVLALTPLARRLRTPFHSGAWRLQAAPTQRDPLCRPEPYTPGPATPPPGRIRTGPRAETGGGETACARGKGLCAPLTQAGTSTWNTARPTNARLPVPPTPPPHAVFKGPGGTLRRRPRHDHHVTGEWGEESTRPRRTRAFQPPLAELGRVSLTTDSVSARSEERS